MKIVRTIWSRLRSLAQRWTVKQEIDEELRFHIEERTAENIAAGMSPEEAAREARRRFGNVQSVREECRDARGASFGEGLLQDVGFGLRLLRKNPAFTLVAVLTLALGIGANTAIFSVVNFVLLRSLPYKDADRLVRIGSIHSKLGGPDSRSSGLNILDWQQRSTSFESLAAFQEWDGVLVTARGSERVRVNWATANLLPMLGVQPLHGRWLTDSDSSSALLSHAFWQRHFMGDAAAIGTVVKLGGEAYTIVGVLPPDASAPVQGMPPLDQVFITLDLQRLDYPRDLQLFNVIGRLKPGVTVDEAQAELTGIARVLEREYPDTNRDWGVKASNLKVWKTQLVRNQLLTAYGATYVILLIACLSVSNLLLIRGEARRKELAIRCALGSSRLRLMRQLLVESLTLSFVSMLVGVLVAFACRGALRAFSPTLLGGLGAMPFDWPVLTAAFGIALLVALGSGLVPAFRLSRDNLSGVLAESGRSFSTAISRHRLLRTLVVSQIAVSTVLLAAAGLAVASFQKLARVDPGFAADNLVCCRIDFPEYFSDPSMGERVIEAVSRLPIVRSAGGANIGLLDDTFANSLRITADDPSNPDGVRAGTVYVWHVTTNYFSAAGVPLLAGRAFQGSDGQDVVVVNQALATRFFPDRNAVGRIIRVPWIKPPGSPKRIIGVVGSIKQRGLQQEGIPIYYLHYQPKHMSHAVLTVRVKEKPAAAVSAIQAAIRAVNPQLVITHVSTGEQLVSQSLASTRFATALMLAFAGLGTLLAGVGLYGVLSYAVSQRRQEIGIRMALGAQRGDVLWLVLREGMALVVFGVAAGLTGALAVTRVMRSLLFEIKPTDPATFIAITLFLCAAGMLACWLPARHAARIDPMTALRHE